MSHKILLSFFILNALGPCCPSMAQGRQILLSCDQTPYPEICTSFMEINKHLPTSNESNFVFHNSILKITLEQAREAHQIISSLNLSSLEKRAKMAWEDCLELYEHTVHHLNRTILASTSVDIITLNNVQTYLSAAIANYETCKEGFNDLKLSSHLESFPPIFTNFSKLVANALAINRASITTYESSNAVQTKEGRKLVASGFPSWVSRVDRRLLDSAMSTIKANLIVAKDGNGDYKTICEAIVASSKLRTSWRKRFIIHVKKGVYNENVVITNKMKNLMLIGDGIDSTIVTGNKNVQDGFTIFRSATFAIQGMGFIAKDISFENTAGPQKHQAVALRSSSDFSIFYNCSFKAYQDTLYLHSHRQFYKNCLILGTVDFIFGDAAAVLQTCRILVRHPMLHQFNTVTAQSRSDPNENTGIVIHDSSIEPAMDFYLAQFPVQTFLGRPWKKYSRVVVMKSYIDGIVDPIGWVPWNGDFACTGTLYYGEYRNEGLGSITSKRVKWAGFHVMRDLEARKFTVGDFLRGDHWIPSTGIPVLFTL